MSRFACASSSFALRPLLGRTSHIFWAALGMALIAHGALTFWRGLEQQARVAKPLTTQFVKRQPRLTKPLEMKKRPQPRRRHLRRRMIAVQARSRGGEEAGKIRAFALAGRLARPDVRVSRGVRLDAAEMEPRAVARMLEGQKEAKDVVDMSLDLLDATDLDTGRYHALVIQDPTDERNIKGFFRLKYAYSESMQKRQWHELEGRMVHSVVGLIEAVNEYTDIEAAFDGKIPFTSTEMMKTPWVFCLVTRAFTFSRADASSLGAYLGSGGFLMCDAWYPNYGEGQISAPVAITSLRSNLKQALATQGLQYGRDWEFEILADDHPMFHCYFDFDGAPAARWDRDFSLAGKVQGVCVNDRWLLVICQKAFVHLWRDPLFPELRNERVVQFGVNSIIFALTQEGSITRRLMDSVK